MPAGSCNNCRLTVTVSDGRGGQTTGTVALCVSSTPPVNHLNPVILRSYRSSGTASPGQVLTYEVVASDPEGSELTFSWQANTGSLGTPDNDSSHSRITWMAPSCAVVDTPTTLTATVTNAFHLTAFHSFTITGLPVCSSGWSLTGMMTSLRAHHSATLLPNGKVLVAGGVYNYLGDPISTAELYDPATNTWSSTGSMISLRASHAATLLPNGKVLVAGGRYVDLDAHLRLLSTAELYDPVTGTWSPTGSMITLRGDIFPVTLLPNGKVLAAAGMTAEVYDPASGSWNLTGSPLEPINGPPTLLPNGKVLVAGGTTAQLYDPATGAWSPTGSLNEPRIGHSATLLLNGKVLIAGGWTPNSPGPHTDLATAELYDPATGTWSPTGSMPHGGPHTATLLADGTVLFEEAGAANLYHPDTGTWSATGPMALSHYSPTATLLLNGKVLVAGGNLDFGQAELYTP